MRLDVVVRTLSAASKQREPQDVQRTCHDVPVKLWCRPPPPTRTHFHIHTHTHTHTHTPYAQVRHHYRVKILKRPVKHRVSFVHEQKSKKNKGNKAEVSAEAEQLLQLDDTPDEAALLDDDSLNLGGSRSRSRFSAWGDEDGEEGDVSLLPEAVEEMSSQTGSEDSEDDVPKTGAWGVVWRVYRFLTAPLSFAFKYT